MYKEDAIEYIKNNEADRTYKASKSQRVGTFGGPEIKVWYVKCNGMNYQLKTTENKRLTAYYENRKGKLVREPFAENAFGKEWAREHKLENPTTYTITRR